MLKNSVNLTIYLPGTEVRIVGCIPLRRVLAQHEIQTTSTSIRTQITPTIAYDDNHYTTSTSY